MDGEPALPESPPMAAQRERPPPQRDRLSPAVAAALIETMTGIFRRGAGLTHELTGVEAAAAAGLDTDVATQVWRAFGLPEIDPTSAKAYDAQDVEALRGLGTLLSAGITLPDLLAVARVYAQAFSRIAEAEERIEE